ncbi:MAG: hypothetical protein Q8L88_07515 [Bacteroidota bacterium]|nr:hypothetical protein [Bacteroidota bacterium]
MNNTALMITLTTTIIALFAVGYIALIFGANRKIIDEQQKTIEEIKRSEQRYKALFENSLAGMMKFNFSSWVIVDTNQAMLDKFNANSIYDLQKKFTELPREMLRPIEISLTKTGMIDSHEITFSLETGIIRRFFFSARREGSEQLAHAVVVLMNSEKKIG